MRSLRIFGLMAGAAVLCACLGTGTKADDWNKKTIVTFGDYVEIPGQVLPPGTYIFKLMDSPSNRHIVQVWSEDERELLATTIAVPIQRYDTPERVIFEFDERPGDSPQALHAWFYPGDNLGNEFIYDYHYDRNREVSATGDVAR